MGMQDHLRVENHAMEPVSFELALRFGTDFADIFAVKDYDFSLGDPRGGRAAAARGHARVRRRGQPVPVRRPRERGAHAGDPLRARRGRRRDDPLADRARATRPLGGASRRPRRPRRRPGGAARGRAPLRRGARARARVARGLEAAGAAAAHELGRPAPLVLAARSPTSPRCGSATGSARCRRRGCRGS